ncbi:MAG: TIGR02757 family protein [Bacteroidota bacterium]
MKEKEIKAFLDRQHDKFNSIDFIENDPVLIPHQYTLKEDIEISGFIAATFAWGQRKTIINKAKLFLSYMDNSPYEFIRDFKAADLKPFKNFAHRTFNGDDSTYLLNQLKLSYSRFGSLENHFYHFHSPGQLSQTLANWKIDFLINNPQHHCKKHFGNPMENSTAKRMFMYFRWMVRQDKRGVDFGIWKQFKPSELFIPLDVHTGNVSRALGLLKRAQDDWKSVDELTIALRKLDAIDPIKYDFALFGTGVEKELEF